MVWSQLFPEIRGPFPRCLCNKSPCFCSMLGLDLGTTTAGSQVPTAPAGQERCTPKRRAVVDNVRAADKSGSVGASMKLLIS